MGRLTKSQIFGDRKSFYYYGQDIITEFTQILNIVKFIQNI